MNNNQRKRRGPDEAGPSREAEDYEEPPPTKQTKREAVLFSSQIVAELLILVRILATYPQDFFEHFVIDPDLTDRENDMVDFLHLVIYRCAECLCTGDTTTMAIADLHNFEVGYNLGQVYAPWYLSEAKATGNLEHLYRNLADSAATYFGLALGFMRKKNIELTSQARDLFNLCSSLLNWKTAQIRPDVFDIKHGTSHSDVQTLILCDREVRSPVSDTGDAYPRTRVKYSLLLDRIRNVIETGRQKAVAFSMPNGQMFTGTDSSNILDWIVNIRLTSVAQRIARRWSFKPNKQAVFTKWRAQLTRSVIMGNGLPQTKDEDVPVMSANISAGIIELLNAESLSRLTAELTKQALVVPPQPERLMCLACTDKPVDAMCVPCGHATMCYGCAERWREDSAQNDDGWTCDQCREEIVILQKVSYKLY